ncbi:hypothetical protein [Bacillus sp. FSL K6-0067]|uniref:hypothetical protein n=1 Tax=Bacillus sp. FSL K6-0067 TaxID=2921412 RepID=UPI00077A73B4|nr:hypothetical protein [Bacillus cereus]KXY29829.1 hypothetical protein AT267_07225 [Bacillus cereus]
MKIVLALKNIVQDMIENVNDIKINERNIYHSSGSFEGLNDEVDVYIFPDEFKISLEYDQETGQLLELELTSEDIEQALDKREFYNKDLSFTELSEQFKEMKEQNAALILDNVKKDEKIAGIKEQQAALILSLTSKGVL